MTITAFSPFVGTVALILSSRGAVATTPPAMTRHDFYVTVKSTAPAMHGGEAKIYVREVVQSAGTGSSAPSKGVVLFVHGAGTPSEVAFDVPHEDYSWMEFLAKAGFDVFAMDMTGYGRSTRPPAMSDLCNLSHAQQAEFIPGMLAQPCAASFPNAMTTMGSDWDDIAAVVDHLRELRHVQRVSLIGWSQGGPRAGAYAAHHPDKVDRLVVLAPAYGRAGALEAPSEPVAMPGGSMSSQSQAEFVANWDRQVGCAGQYDPAVSKVIWKEMLSSDTVGATWGPGVRRAPQVPTWGFNHAVVSAMTTPFLMVSGANDKQVPQENVRELYADLGSKQKVFIDLACSSHNAMWEKNHLLLFQASLEWLSEGKVGGVAEGMLRRGY